MSNIYVVTDSSAQLTDEEIKDNNIKVVPLDIVIDDQSYVDGVDISREEFIKKMESSENLPKTSQPPIGSFQKVYQEIADNDSDAEIIAIMLSESLSGTVNAARQAADMVDINVTVVDSEFTDRAESFQVLEAAKMAKEGKSVSEILDHLNKVRTNTSLYMGVTNLENIIKGGRLGKLAGTLSTFLNINIGLIMKDSKLSIAKKGRGKKTLDKYMDEVVDKIKNTEGIKAVGISHADAEEYANKVKERIQAVIPQGVEILVRTTSPIISTHSGTGAFAVMFYY